MPLLGTDIYGGNADSKVLAAIAREDFVYHIFKASEGRTLKDADHDRNVGWAEDAGDVAGSYHFSWMSNPGADEAKWFLDCAQPRAGQLIAGDFEDWGTTLPDKGVALRAATPWSQRWRHAMDWTRVVIEETGTLPLLYVNWNYLKGFRTVSTVADWEWWIDCPLWLAQWQTGGVQTKPGQFDYAAPHKRPDGSFDGTKEWHPTFHQYISGSTSPSGLDEDWFVGDRIALQSFTIQPEELFTVGQFEDIMTALAALSQRVETLEGLVGETRDNLASVEVGVEEAETSILDKVGQVAGDLGMGQATISGHVDEMTTTVASAASSAVAETIDATLGGIEMSARYVRTPEGSR